MQTDTCDGTEALIHSQRQRLQADRRQIICLIAHLRGGKRAAKRTMHTPCAARAKKHEPAYRPPRLGPTVCEARSLKAQQLIQSVPRSGRSSKAGCNRTDGAGICRLSKGGNRSCTDITQYSRNRYGSGLRLRQIDSPTHRVVSCSVSVSLLHCQCGCTSMKDASSVRVLVPVY